ncbi:unnamed protein product [Cladocopium goreaui]|uniref:Uncharacterized protein n=1 Tax=Cladocopium goreaui TaxID=2562237 RepID=A0A9P1M398_9DINO|nr:unnamed protein product [Cladocopium goreaui]|mmetsp:Transcript_67999/g.137879  ORF Transcript_67999/g.137879 Transcript_67999/m.137879 type:complete len:160 (-) Transcript_67999:267-746(-)
MAGWDRYGEEKKYRKDVDINDNPKHVGEPLRKLTLEDRLEIRRQTREQQKKRSVSMAEINEDLESDDVDLSGAAVTSPSKRPKVIDGDGDGELDIIGVASSNGKKAKEVVDLADDDNASRAAAIRRARRRAKAKGKHPGIRPAPKVATVANGDEVEVLE